MPNNKLPEDYTCYSSYCAVFSDGDATYFGESHVSFEGALTHHGRDDYSPIAVLRTDMIYGPYGFFSRNYIEMPIGERICFPTIQDEGGITNSAPFCGADNTVFSRCIDDLTCVKCYLLLRDAECLAVPEELDDV